MFLIHLKEFEFINRARVEKYPLELSMILNLKIVNYIRSV